MTDDQPISADTSIGPVSPPSTGGAAVSSADIPIIPSSNKWYVTVPGCYLGKVKVKGIDAVAAEAAYRSIAGLDCNPATPAIVEQA